MAKNNPYAALEDPDIKEIFESFLVETKEIFENLDIDLVELEQNPNDSELLNKVFRSFHTIKGTSGFLGLEKIQKVTHKCEDILNKLRKGEANLSSDLMDGILRSFDILKALLISLEKNKNEDVGTQEIVNFLDKLYLEMETGGTLGGKENLAKSAQEKPESEENSALTRLNLEDQKKEQKTNAVQKIQSYAQQKAESSIRVDVERLDDLLNIVSELVLGRNRLLQINTEVSLENEGSKISRDLADTAKHIDLMTTELQLAVMKTRMIKIGKVFNKFPRLVRDLCREMDKDIQLVIEGEDTELDKTLIEEINDPLVHLVRNSVDHGIEKPEIRLKKNKNGKGTIVLSAEHEGNNVIISIKDDGKGIDPEAIKSKAVQKGLITRDKANELSKQDIYNLIFLPGFSTAEMVTNVSGRGVGMDVVKTNVQKLRGMINIESDVDKGTKIIIKLPLTLAIIQGLLVKVKGETIVVPLNSVIEVVRIHEKDIYHINRNEVIKIRDSVLPLLSVDKLLFEMEDDNSENSNQYVVIVGLAEKRFGLKVDELIGQKEVVIKSLGQYLGNIHGISGSTIMGDGKVVMIVDIGELIHYIAENE